MQVMVDVVIVRPHIDISYLWSNANSLTTTCQLIIKDRGNAKISSKIYMIKVLKIL